MDFKTNLVTIAPKDKVSKMKNIGVVLSAGGSSFFTASEIFSSSNDHITVVTDRECGALEKAKSLNIDVIKVEFINHKQFSLDVLDIFLRKNVEVVLLNFSRLITSELFEKLPTFNVHPSLLPSFKGMGAVKQARHFGSVYQGASLHWVDEGVDTGHLIGQTIYPVSHTWDLNYLNKLSYLQKTAMNLLFFELINESQYLTKEHLRKSEGTDWLLQPALKDKYKRNRLAQLFKEAGFNILP